MAVTPRPPKASSWADRRSRRARAAPSEIFFTRLKAASIRRKEVTRRSRHLHRLLVMCVAFSNFNRGGDDDGRLLSTTQDADCGDGRCRGVRAPDCWSMDGLSATRRKRRRPLSISEVHRTSRQPARNYQYRDRRRERRGAAEWPARDAGRRRSERSGAEAVWSGAVAERQDARYAQQWRRALLAHVDKRPHERCSYGQADRPQRELHGRRLLA